MATVETWVWVLSSVLVVSAMSLVGAFAAFRWVQRHAVVLTLVALAAGALLGDALFHLMPESSELWDGFTLEMAGLVLAGFLVFFVLETALRYGHAHGEHTLLEPHEHHPIPKTAGTSDAARHAHPPVAPFAWTNLAGDGMHNLIDGVIVAAAFSQDMVLGLTTTLAVALHEIPQELGDFAVLVRAGFSRKRALFYNFLSALTAMAGALTFLLLPFDQELMEKIALPITAGGFLYIAAADLIPELHHHTGDRHSWLILVGFGAGLAVMAALLLLEGLL